MDLQLTSTDSPDRAGGRAFGTEWLEAHWGCQISIAVRRHHDQKQLGEERVYFSLHFHITGQHGGKSGQELKQWRNLEAGADAEAVEGCYLLACFFMACSACFS